MSDKRKCKQIPYQKIFRHEKRLDFSKNSKKETKVLQQRLNIVIFFIKYRRLLGRKKMPSDHQASTSSSFDLDSESREVWPANVKLYQPYEVEQILLPDNAHCLAVQAYLKMAGLKYAVDFRKNAEYMSPSNRVPFIRVGHFLIAELDPIVKFTQNKGWSLSGELDESAKSDMRAYMSLVTTVLVNAEHYITWCDPVTYHEVTKVRHGAVAPWPLNIFLTYKKKITTQNRLKALEWLQKSLNEVYADVDKCCQSLSERLENNNFFFKDRPTELDALVFGHIYAILTTPLPNNRLAATIRAYPNLVDHCTRIEEAYFKKTDS
uniref:Metaxin-2 n=1 Tax=Cacopsylla melanoneura TaxID=428564 RepID=A0A8D8X3U1_9HEMI